MLFVVASTTMGGVPKSARLCPVCDGPVAPLEGPGQPRRYCSSRCKSRAARRRRELGLAQGSAPTGESRRASTRTRQPRRDYAIALVIDDPFAMMECLSVAQIRIESPFARETGWGLVADRIRLMAKSLGDEPDEPEEPEDYDW